MTVTAIATQEAVELAKRAADILPQAGKIDVLNYLVSVMTEDALKALSPQARKQLLQALAGNEAAPSATTSPAFSEIKLVDGHQAVVGQISVKDLQLDTLLSEGSFKKTRPEQIKYAAELGYRMATRDENLAYFEYLLAQEANKNISGPEMKALDIYRERRYMMDAKGGLIVDGRSVCENSIRWFDYVFSDCGALFVRASAESK